MAKNLKAELENLPAAAAEFIELVISKMRYRKKIRSDVMAELIAHFEDELKGCADGEEKERKAQELVAQFGDAKLLGVLLRKAKKRCRPLWRTVAAKTFQAAAVLILCLIVYTIWFLSGKPNITVDYVAELNRIVRPTADESLNAAPFYGKAIQVYEEKASDEISELLRKKYEEVTAEQKETIEKWLNDNKEIFNLVLAGTDKPYYWPEYRETEGREGEGVISVIMPNLSEFRRIVWALRWRAWLSAENGLCEDAFNDLMVCYRLSRHLTGDLTLVEQLVGIAMMSLANNTIRDILSEHQIDSDTLAELQKEFEETTDDKSFAISFKTERLMLYDGLQRCFTAGPDGHVIPKRLVELLSSAGGNAEIADSENILVRTLLLSAAYMLFLHPDRDETLKSGNAFYDYYEELALQTPAKTKIYREERDAELKELCKKNFILSVLMPALDRVIQISYRLSADVKGTMAVIALLRHEQDTGFYPESLEELVTSGYMKGIPMDPWSDRPLVYRKTEDDFILYSVSFNFTDDGGQVYRDDEGGPRLWAEESDAVFWPVGE